ncbi:MAG: myo-inositol-1(or 4)-monophosphatase [Candidatus Magnetoglobus multicellularis str. Araruama]|uniref:Inositol-1-monophosphatase n=1 Tax=Candidatus Magnetoglobus multicellularis str. Araruama TaxID=890399 RepID=A0A1V1PHA3_9BACT|nr:MAG: myo-inositol-1(or 4)-monophosphatase [Candidatus Magnetoglobus multicellularis str. Araruama]
MNLNNIYQVAIAAAYHAGEILNRYYGNLKDIHKKGAIDLVTEADVASEKAVKQIIQKHYPDHGIIAEESGTQNTQTPYEWIIDPLDGTTNYAHQIPIFSVSISFVVEKKPVVGVVFNPVAQELFCAIKGCGATYNQQSIAISQTKALSDSILVTGFPYNLREMIDPLITRFSNCLQSAQAVRRLGAASLDLCYVASGRFDGFWEQNLKPWDTAAGMLIAQEAGANITNFSDQSYHYNMSEIIATNGYIHQDLLECLAIH